MRKLILFILFFGVLEIILKKNIKTKTPEKVQLKNESTKKKNSERVRNT